jgi:hypothetical protein
MEKEKKTNINEDLITVSKRINQLQEEKNLSVIMKEYNEINSKIKKMLTKVNKLKTKFEENINNDKKDIDDEKYEDYLKIFSSDNIDKIISSNDIDYQITEYRKLVKSADNCKQYLENKKLTIIECDK